MLQLVRFLLTSGVLVAVGSRLIAFFSRYSNTQLLRGGALLLLAGWAVTVADAFLPVLSAPPLGLLAFLLAGIASIASTVLAFVLALTVLYRAARSRSASSRAAESAGSTSAGPAVPVAVLIAVIAVASFVGERVFGLIAAVHG